MSTLERAIEIATLAHAGRVDKVVRLGATVVALGLEGYFVGRRALASKASGKTT